MITQAAGTTASPNSTPIVAEETGVAISYEATKNISCGNFEWRVNWKSGPAKRQIRGDVTVVIAGKSKALPEVQAQVFDKFATIDGISATCNKIADSEAVRSSLLISGNNLENSKKSLAQLRVGPDFKLEWSLDTVE